jgi:serine/threonine protein kinase
MALEELQNGRYKRLRLLGTGGMGEVHLMEDSRINRQVAIKVIRSEGAAYPDRDRAGDAARLFQREAKAIAALEHPNILPLYDFGEEALEDLTITYMVMPFCPDGSLTTWVKQRSESTGLQPHDIAHLIEQAAEGLQYAHDQQVIHLDVKPSNFLLRVNKKRPNRPTLLLADFGIARNFTTVSSSSRTIRGTPTSMAPEQWSGSPVLATDQYALAVMAYEMLVGRPPFVGSMEQLMYRHFSVVPDPPSRFNPQITPAIDAVLVRALTKKPEERFPSIAAFSTALTEAIQELPAVSGDLQGISSELYSTGPSQGSDPGLSQMLTLAEDKAARTAQAQKAPEDQATFTSDPRTPSGEILIDNNATQQTPERIEPVTPAAPLVLADTSAQPAKAQRSDADKITEPSKSKIAAARAQESAISASEHNLPTLSVTASGIQELEHSERSARPRKSPALLIVSIALAALLVILLSTGTIYFFNGRQSSANLGDAGASSTVTVQATTAPKPTPTFTPTPPPGLYIAGSYNGSFTTENGSSSTAISVYIVQTQGQGVLTGSVTYTSSGAVHPLTGTIDMNGKFSFTITGLFFTGQYQGSYIKGNYCASNTNSCIALTGYFTAGPKY